MTICWDITIVERHGVVIQVRGTGVCRSDWHGWKGHDPDIQLPHVPGHEFAGIVAEVGRDITRWKVGDRVTVALCRRMWRVSKFIQ